LPFFSGRPLRLIFGDRRCVPVWSTASVEWLLCALPETVNTVLQFYVVFRGPGPKATEICRFCVVQRPARMTV
ncbi:hypothetical protein, partial [Sphingomonas azotifigens]|uniref:hypothetical protein n=1 Tax=Sphingomonas azotifigens TaxID=330920 RepID=UPI001C3FAE66